MIVNEQGIVFQRKEIIEVLVFLNRIAIVEYGNPLSATASPFVMPLDSRKSETALESTVFPW